MTPTTTQTPDRQILRELIATAANRAAFAINTGNIVEAVQALRDGLKYAAKMTTAPASNGYSINATNEAATASPALPVPGAGRYSLNDL
jgi:hypothetical protein